MKDIKSKVYTPEVVSKRLSEYFQKLTDLMNEYKSEITLCSNNEDVPTKQVFEISIKVSDNPPTFESVFYNDCIGFTWDDMTEINKLVQNRKVG